MADNKAAEPVVGTILEMVSSAVEPSASVQPTALTQSGILPSGGSELDVLNLVAVAESSPAPDPDSDGDLDMEGSNNEESDREGDQEEEFVESKDIRSDLEDALKNDLDFSGSISFKNTYLDAPNPFLRLDGCGHIGLPINPREAKAIISVCKQAPFGKGEETLIDTSVRDTWEIDASAVHFDNPEWSGFVRRVAGEVCETLGVDCRISKPRAELYKLLVYETGSHFLPHQDTEKVPGMFGTIVIILPSLYTGGTAYLTHGGISTILDCSSTSNFRTSVLAWYTDVVHEIKPITSGYRVALSYNLVHKAHALRPSLPSSHEAVNTLRQILVSWTRRADTTPLKIVYLLTHEYAQSSLRGSALKGSDAHKVGLLDFLAKGLGFRVALASLERYVRGDGDEHGGYSHADASMGEVHEDTMSITNVVDLDGQPIDYEITCEEDEGETIPEELSDAIARGGPDEEEYEGYQGNSAGSMEHWYRRTVLLIWPDVHSVELERGKDGALAVVQHATSQNQDERVHQAVEYLLRAAATDRIPKSNVARAVCHAAGAWNNLRLWQRAVKICGADQSVGVLGGDNIFTSIGRLGFDNVQPTVEAILKNEKNNTTRLKYLDDLGQRTRGQAQMIFSPWIAQQRKAVIESLKAPTNEEAPLLIDIARERGGISYLNKNIVPQIKEVADSQFLLFFARHLRKHWATLFPGATLEDEPTLDRMVTDLLSAAISNVLIYEPKDPDIAHYWHTKPPKPPATPINDVISILDACFETGNERLSRLMLARVVEAEYLTLKYITRVLVPLLPAMVNLCNRRKLAITAEPFGFTCKAITMLWIEKALGPRPADGIIADRHADTIREKMVCACAHCRGALEFLLHSNARKKVWHGIGAPSRRHLEDELSKSVSGLVSWQMIQSVPQGLTVTKLDIIFAIRDWKANAGKGVEMLKSISPNTEVLRSIFGSDYSPVIELLTGKRVSQPPVNAPAGGMAPLAHTRPENPKTWPTNLSAASSAGAGASDPRISLQQARTPSLKRKRSKDIDKDKDIEVIDLTSP